MKLTDYSNLKEIHSLDNMIKVHLDKISEEESRIDFISQKRKQKDQELEDLILNKSALEKEISDSEVKLFDLEKRFKNANDHLPLASSEKEVNALQNEINTLGPQIDLIQESSLEKLEEIEELEKLINQSQNFLKGSLETLEEIKNEIEEVRKVESVPIHQYENRITLLIEQTPKSLFNHFKIVRDKFRYKRPIVRIVNHACEFCHFRVDQMTLDRVESMQGIENCTQCGRLFIPLEA